MRLSVWRLVHVVTTFPAPQTYDYVLWTRGGLVVNVEHCAEMMCGMVCAMLSK